MTERIPAGMTPGGWAEQQIREAMDRGEFDDLAGAGQPLDLRDGASPTWWLERKMRDEEFVAVPASLQLRRDRDEMLAVLPSLPSERFVREVLDRLNGRILYANSHGIDGPPVALMPLDVDALVAGWLAARPQPGAEQQPEVVPRGVRRLTSWTRRWTRAARSG